MHHLKPPSSFTAVLRSRTDTLVALFDSVAKTRMAGIPILNPALRVEALGFELCQGHADQPGEPQGGVGVLITPWFMNLVWFPLERIDQPHAAGTSRPHQVGTECFDFIARYESIFGSYEACSLFSPMFEFHDHAAARATGQAVLSTLRQPPMPAPAKPSDLAARRAFLFGRRSSAGDAP